MPGNWWDDDLDAPAMPAPAATAGAAAAPSSSPSPAGDWWDDDPDDDPAASASRAEVALAPFVQGATLGFGDEIGAFVDSKVGGGGYDDLLARNRAVLARAKRERPVATLATEAAGGLVPGLLGGGLGLAATLPRTVARSALVGGAEGAAYGAGTGEGAADRLGRAGAGALAGAAVGGAAPLAVETARAGVRGARTLFTPKAAAAGDLRRAIARDAMTPAGLATRAGDLAAVRPGTATVADAGGENVRGLVERVSQTPGAGRTVAVPFLEERQRGQLARLTADLGRLAGAPKGAMEAVEGAMAARSAAAAPLYAKAMAFPGAPALDAAFKAETARGWGRSILASPALRKTLQTEHGVDDVAKAPPMVLVDAWKRQADDLVTAARRSGDANKARVVGSMRDRVLAAADAANPDYAGARAAWAGPTRYMEAVEEGRRIVAAGPDEVAAFMRKATEAEREGFRIGAVSALAGRMGNDAADLADYTKYVRSPAMRAKLAAIMPTPELAAKWGRGLDAEVGMSRLAGRALGNSATARRLGERADADGLAGDLLIDAATGTPAAGLVTRIARGTLGKVRDTARSRTDKALAEILTSTDAAGMLALLRRPPPAGYGPGPSAAGPALGGLLGMPAAALAAGPPAGLLGAPLEPRPRPGR